MASMDAATSKGQDAREQGAAREVRIIAMLNQKGGVGKTTSTVNIGAALAAAGRRVCLIDLDPQAHLTLHLGIDSGRIGRTVYDLLIDPDCAAEEALVRDARPNLDAIFAEVDLAAAETELSQHPDRQRILRTKFEPIASRYDFVLLDCPPSLGLLTLNALCLAHEVIVPMQAQFLALQGVGKLLETVGLVCRSVNSQLRVGGIVLCMHEGQTMLAREVVADLDAFFAQSRDKDVPWRDCCVFQPAIRRNIKLAEAPSFGQTIFDYAPWCPGAQDYAQLAARIAAGREPRSADSASAATTSRSGDRGATVEVKPPAENDEPAAAADSAPQIVTVANTHAAAAVPSSRAR
jgi:chromosome partitioning protein